MRRSLRLGLALSVLAGLASIGAQRGSVEWRTMVVEQYGRMQDVLGGDGRKARALVSLAQVMKRQPQAVALGALAGLQGEFTILDGKAWIARPSGHGLLVEGPLATSKERAAFLIVANVEAWEDIPIDEAIGGPKLERFIPGRTRQRRLDPDHPFPFVIEGTFTQLDVRSIGGASTTTGPFAPGDMAPWRHHTTTPVVAKVVGFYAPLSGGNVTEPGTPIHAHAFLEIGGQMVTAHVERMAVSPGAVLRIPAWHEPSAR